MKCNPASSRYTPCWSGALMDPAFLRQATNDRATASDAGGMHDEPAGSHVDPAALRAVQTWWRRLVRARGVLGLDAATRAFRGAAAGGVLSAIARSEYGRSAVRSSLVGGPH
jgi:hypothetical protein